MNKPAFDPTDPYPGNKKSGTEIYLGLLKLAIPHWPVFLLGLIAMIANGIVDLSFAYLMKPLMDQGLIEPDPQLAVFFSLAIIVIFFLRGLTSYTATYCITWIGRRIVALIRRDMFNHLVMLPAQFYDHASTGSLLSHLSYNTEQVAGAATKAVTVLISDSIKAIFQIGLMFYLSVYLSLGFFIIAPVVILLILLISKRLQRISHNIQNAMGKASHVAEEAITGHLVVKAFEGQDYEKYRYKKAVEDNRVQSMKLVATDALNVPTIQFVVSLVLAGTVFIMVSGYLPGAITPGDFVAYMTAMSILLPSIKRLTSINTIVQRGIVAGQSIFSFLEVCAETDRGTLQLKTCQGHIQYQEVVFRYQPDKPLILDKVSIDIQPKTLVALVGHSGSGKSTLVNLLARFYEVNEGQITIDGQPLSHIERRSLREQIAYVGQDFTLFNDTIRHNIAYGRLSESSTKQIMTAVKQAHAWEFIKQLPDGLDTLVGENGVLLSGGQRQRLAIARALLKDAPILILDEATSALDSVSEKHIQASLNKLISGRTTLVVAHRLSTVEKADVIFVMDKGKVVESGRHADLLERNQTYATLYNTQFS